MRLLAAICCVLSFAALLCANYLPNGPYWYAALYALPLVVSLFVVTLAGALLEHLLGMAFRAVAPAVGVALALFAVLHCIFAGAPGVLPEGLPFEGLAAKALSIVALGAVAGAILMGSLGLRAPYLASQICATLALGGAAVAVRETIVGFGLPCISRFSVGLIALAMPFFVFSAWMRRPSAPSTPDEDPPETEPPR